MSRIRRLALLTGLLATLPAAAQAQSYATDRGSMLIGGSAGFSSSGLEVEGQEGANRSTFLNFSPSVQYFVLPGLAVGGDVVAQRSSAGDDANTTLGVGPAASYYFGGAERSVYPFVSGSVLYLRTSGDNVDSESSTGYSASTGAVLMLNRSAALRGSLYYQARFQDVADDVEATFDSYGVSLGVTVFAF